MTDTSIKFLITGSSSGIGEAIIHSLCNIDEDGLFQIYGVHNDEASESVRKRGVNQIKCDLRNSDDIYSLLPEIDFDVIVNCAGVNYINWILDTPEDKFDDLMATNAKSIFLVTKRYIPSLTRKKGTILNIISNASHTPMTNSIAYNASKGAAHIMTLQMARELGPKGITVFGISPNKVSDTRMSEYIDSRVCDLRGWTKEEAREYQMKCLPAGEETDKLALAEFVGFLLSLKYRHIYLAGTVIPYGK